ncbi:nitroreductase [Saccharibacillus sp. CPCC 101409]|uniref:nitroreductase family protein n=1 Tax=Saccharibacillus sp. CPCC 101409 TaxID=3058041 RepID=UPI002670E9DE|nr:nitroreductase [Saccharibacillus sp. CPCC 101409]MDO3408955.1 nitroreductase [Saccharibacillus sp. CPCC 101409]
METQSGLTLSEIVRGRRTIQEFNGEPIDSELLLELLGDAVWAPFHSKKEPWRFILFTGEGRRVFAEAVIACRPPAFAEKYGAQMREAYCRQIPVHLVVVMKNMLPPKAWEEALAATAALIQNIQLLAWEKGIGCVWKTSPFNDDETFRAAVGVESGEKAAATLHLGCFDPADRPEAKPRTPVRELLTWIDGASGGGSGRA